jgi:hypothetical protein
LCNWFRSCFNHEEKRKGRILRQWKKISWMSKSFFPTHTWELVHEEEHSRRRAPFQTKRIKEQSGWVAGTNMRVKRDTPY